MPVNVTIEPSAQDDIDDLDASILPDIEAKIDAIQRNWPDVARKPLTGPWRGHFRIQVRKDWRIIVRPEGGGLKIVRVFHRSSRGYEEGIKKMRRDVRRSRTGFVVVPSDFVEESLRGRPPRNFAGEYVRWVLGQNLRAARARARLSQAALAERIGRAQSTISMSEKGLIRVSTAYVRAVLKACGVPRTWSRKDWASG